MKNFKLIRTVLFTIVMCFHIIACGSDNESNIIPDEKPTITIDSDIITNGISFAAEGEEKFINFVTNTDWILNIANTTGMGHKTKRFVCWSGK